MVTFDDKAIVFLILVLQKIASRKLGLIGKIKFYENVGSVSQKKNHNNVLYNIHPSVIEIWQSLQ